LQSVYRNARRIGRFLFLTVFYSIEKQK